MSSLRESLTYEPHSLAFGTSGLRDLVGHMTDLECYINMSGFLQFLRSECDLAEGVNVYIAGDLRDSTPRILQAINQAVVDFGCEPVHCGLIPTPALASYALRFDAPCAMVTGSHIPADRNGIKFYKQAGEVLKTDEGPILKAVAEVRQRLYEADAEASPFNSDGSLRKPVGLAPVDHDAQKAYLERYTSLYEGDALAGRKVVFYQHSSVGRDIMADVLRRLGAEVVTVGRSESFIPIDSENVTPADRAYFRELAEEHPDAFAIVSADGDADRPFVVDETGVFHRGDVLGAVTAAYLKADAAAYPASTNDAVDKHLDSLDISHERTKIGSPYVVSAMQDMMEAGRQRVTGWEVNGGFMTAQAMKVGKGELPALPTRDALLPIIAALHSAASDNIKVSELFGRLPQRHTQAGLIDNFPVEISQAIKAHFSADEPALYDELAVYFTADKGFTKIAGINNTDGVRISFDNGEIAHLRASSNAPQMRIYSNADTQQRADEIVALALDEPEGVLRRMEAAFKAP